MRALVAAAVVLAGCGAMPWNPYGGWKVVRTKHLTIYTSTRFLHTHTAESLEYAYAALGASLFRTRTIAPVEVLFLEDPEMVASLGPFRSGASIGRLPGQGVLGRRGLVVLGETTEMPSAAHRLAHLFLHSLAPKAPLWIQEGYASYAETIQYQGDGNSQVACLGHLNFGEPMIPLEELFAWSWAGYDQSKKTDWYRHTARSLLDYFLMGENKSLHKQFATLMVALTEGRATKEALAEAFPGLSVADLEKRMVQHRRESEARPRGLCPLPFPIAPERGADFHNPRFEPLAKEDIRELFLRLWLLPRRAGYVDWFPPAVLTLAGAREAI
jgi:hypothetical protein